MTETASQGEAAVLTPPKRSLKARALGSSAWSVLNFGSGQAMRLMSNLILTRILSPDDFGLMALVTSFMIGLAMFSDVGFGTSIMQSKRGDDPDFLDTAWTLKILRGFLLFIMAAALAWPLAQFYKTPEFAVIFPATAISLLIGGFLPTRMDTAARHMAIGRLTVLELINQALGMIITIIAALILKSVWALVIGNVLGAAVQLLMYRWFLPGHRNRFRMELAARSEILHFGKWIFLSTICGFMLFQGDRIILGRELSMTQLGIYNIGLFLATVPAILGAGIGGKVFIPMYRDHPAGESARNYRILSKARSLLSVMLLGTAALLALIGPSIVGFLYDARYAMAGGILVAIACIQLVQVIPLSYDYSALAAGDSRGFFLMQSSRAVIYITLVLIGTVMWGLAGLLIGQALSLLVNYPIQVWLARRHRAWDPRHDAVAAVFAVIVAALALNLHWDIVSAALAR